MSSNQIAPPRLPEPPLDYTQQYMADLTRALELFIAQERNPGEMRGTKITVRFSHGTICSKRRHVQRTGRRYR